MAKKWIQKATESMERRGTKGSFTAAAKKGESTSQHVARVLAPGSHASAKMKKKAQFAKNVMGGNTVLPAGSMKRADLTSGPKHNKSVKEAFASGNIKLSSAEQPSTSILGSTKPESKAQALKNSRSHNQGADSHFDRGGQRSENLKAKDAYCCGN